jgi:hypothetical protein
MNQLVAHLHVDFPLDRAKQFKLLVPRHPLGKRARTIVKQPDRQGELALERKRITSSPVELSSNIVRFEPQGSR